MASNDDQKIYPGNLERYRDLRKLREEAEVGVSGDEGIQPTPPQEYAALCIAEELAGLSYILDGIRYSARKN